jgi:hypothetical protein
MGVSFGLTQKLFLSAFEYAWAPFYYANARQPDAGRLFASITTYGIAALALMTAFFFGQASTGDGRETLETGYQLDADPAISAEAAALNAAIPRIAADPQFRHPDGLGGAPGSEANSPQINGTISIPVVSIHTIGELFVPFHMEQIYAERVAANGNADLLVTRAIRDTGHCEFTLDEEIDAFDDMVSWVETGVRPAGDAVLDPAVVADPNFGCQFTTATRDGIPACP